MTKKRTQTSDSPNTADRLAAELSFNRARKDHEPVTDSSLTYGDLRLLARQCAVIPDAAQAVEEYSCRTPVQHIATEMSALAERLRQAAAPSTGAGMVRGLVDQLLKQAAILERHAFKSKCWPGDNDFEDAAKPMREAAAILAALEPVAVEAEPGWAVIEREPNTDQIRALFTMNSALPRTTEEAKAVYQAILNLSSAPPATAPLSVDQAMREKIKTFLRVRDGANSDDYPWSQLNEATDILRALAALKQEGSK